MNFDKELTLLSEEQVWGVNGGRQLDVLEKYGTKSAITDLVVLTGGFCEDSCTYMTPDDSSLKGRTGWCYIRSSDGNGDVRSVNKDGSRYYEYRYQRNGAIRPALLSSYLFSQISPNRVRGYNGTEEVEYGEYPQFAPDDRTQTLVSKRGILAGIRFHTDSRSYNGDFSTTDMKEYLDKYMMRDLFQTATLTQVANMTPEENKQYEEEQKRLVKRRNPYGLDFEEIKEEDIINGAIEADIPVFLHGKSSDGKSARVKAIDPDLTIIYLRNATPDSLNGKSVYNEKTGEMIDIKPTWLKKLEDKCNNEPNKNHILFFDEITNAFPSIQGIAFNIILDKEVNGTWKLPKNARIVAAGNELSDSLAANELAEPLFNRFAHIYINTTTESWLKWASDNNIHPAIYSYIAYRNGETLRTKYNGETPNADPRKWEMASNMLYKTGNPVMLRALVGEDVCRDFIKFCKIRVITIDDVINNRYDINFITNMDSSEKYATVLGLSQVKEGNFKIVRDFIKLLGSEFLTTFDNIWARNDINRLEMIASERLTKSMK